MVKAVFVLALLGLIAVNSVSAEDLKCYICDDCDEAKGSATCDKDNLYETESTPTPTPTTLVPEDNSTSSSTETVVLRDDAPKYKCFTLKVKKDDKTTTKRGCTLQTCEKIEKDEKGTECKDCNSENCNPASNIQSWAFTSVALLAIVKMFF